MEIHWGDACQLYVTPVGRQEICVVLISRDQRLRLAEVLPWFPGLAHRLASAEPLNLERGGVTVSRRLRAVARGNVALVGDASGSVDAITGEGLCLLFQQRWRWPMPSRPATCRDTRRPTGASAAPRVHVGHDATARRSRRLRGRTIRAMEVDPRLFEGLLTMHVGAGTVFDFFTNGLALGWRMLSL